MKTKIYLAVPYSHPDAAVRQERFELANAKAADLMNQGYIVFSPISHSHPIAVQGTLPLDFEFWQAMNESFIEWCDKMFVCKIDGWEESVGIKGEIRIADSLGREVLFI